ncbi:glutamate racemase [Granulicella rosea]|uniref:Glutamate racemase n=1 Tax=Granulicella rosea TaxID=474952 RepID=A0A239IG49_9BACT|nr:glutamate racemase [Granulicella rosea]SNS92545.1 glutamate racemase [Granulicella rosea]
MSNPSKAGPTIGVFDSGFGGLTVLRRLLPLIPGAHYIYLGDTARLPYGAKSQQTIARYTLSSAQFLEQQGAEMLVVACNTASALAMAELKAGLSIPVVGVIEPGVQAAGPADHAGAPRLASATWDSTEPTVLVLATAATVQSHAYAQACEALGLKAYEKACPLLVPLVEEGWIDHPVTADVLRIYLKEALAAAPTVTTLLLGCTHYPLIEPLVRRTLAELGHPLRIVDSATATAQAASLVLPATASTEAPTCEFYATDSVEKFQRLGSQFLGQTLPKVELIDLGG